jgi:DNA-binding NarL/FixJ family response regulator
VPETPVAVAAVNDYELIVSGLASVLAKYNDRVRVVDRFVIGEPVQNGPIDVALFDTYGRVGIAERALKTLTEHPEIKQVALFSLDFPSPLIADAKRLGITTFISKSLPGQDIADALVSASRGRSVAAFDRTRRAAHSERNWPGRSDGLTERESQVLVLCAEGLSNREIAEALYLSPETVKSHLKRIYRHLELRNRAHAATYVQKSGAFARFQPAEVALEGSSEIRVQPVSRGKRRS